MLKNNWEIIVIYLRHSEARNFSVNPHISESDSEIREEFLKIDIINGVSPFHRVNLDDVIIIELLDMVNT